MNDLAEIVKANPTLDDFSEVMRSGIGSGELVPVDMPLTHYHPEGLYGRQIFMPAGTVLTSRVHNQQHLTVVLTGHCTVVDEKGEAHDVRAPMVFVTEPGTQRALHIHEDSIWLTVHATTLKAVDELEEALTCPSMEIYEQRFLEVQP